MRLCNRTKKKLFQRDYSIALERTPSKDVVQESRSPLEDL